jgi:hypothetical protein
LNSNSTICRPVPDENLEKKRFDMLSTHGIPYKTVIYLLMLSLPKGLNGWFFEVP